MRPQILERPLRPLAAVLAGGLAAAVLDITYAFVVFGLRGVSPMRILQSVASGLLGKASYAGGAAAAALGGLLHVAIALVMAAVYGIASRFLPTLNKRPWLWGPAYGFGCYVVMNLVVLPLRFGPRPAPDLDLLLGGVAIHMFGVGLPIALFAARAAFAPPTATPRPQPDQPPSRARRPVEEGRRIWTLISVADWLTPVSTTAPTRAMMGRNAWPADAD